MKLIPSLLAIVALTLVTSARAQDESPSPASEEKASATVEAPSASAEATPSASPEEKSATTAASPAEKKESAAASPSPAAKKEAAAEPTKAAAKKAGPDTGSAESNIKRLENEWEASIKNHDTSFLQARVADDYLGTSPKGKRVNKSGLLKEFKSDTDTYTSAKNGSITVRTFGSNIAIATGTSKEVGKGKDGKAFTRTYAWTDTWMLRGKLWQCIGSQAMLLSGK